MESIDVKKLSNDKVLELFKIMTSNQLNPENMKKVQFFLEKYKNMAEILKVVYINYQKHRLEITSIFNYNFI